MLFGSRLWLLLLAAASTCLGCCLVAALLRASARRPALLRQLPPNLSIPDQQLRQYDNGSFTFNWMSLDRCITRLNCPPDFFSCRAPEQASLPGGLLHMWHHFLLLGWALFTCHQLAGMRKMFMAPSQQQQAADITDSKGS